LKNFYSKHFCKLFGFFYQTLLLSLILSFSNIYEVSGTEIEKAGYWKSIASDFYFKRVTGDTIKYIWPATICDGSSGLQLTANNAPVGASFAWKKDGNAISGATSGTYTATDAGTYSVEVTNGSPTATYTGVTVIKSSVPTSNFTFSPDNQCSDVQVSFSNTSTGATRYQWDFGDPSSGSSNTSTTASPSHTFSSVGGGIKSYIVKLTAYNAAGCINIKTKKYNLTIFMEDIYVINQELETEVKLRTAQDALRAFFVKRTRVSCLARGR